MINDTKITVQHARSACMKYHEAELFNLITLIMERSNKGISYTDVPNDTPSIILDHLQKQGFDIRTITFLEYKWIRIWI